MSFSEPLKLTVKQQANFTCCWCQNHGNKVDVHHIIRESQGGSDTEENAAPLCGSCHDLYGNNPDLQKEIRARRDHWYELCSRAPYFMTAPSLPPVSESEQILVRVVTLAGKLTEGLSSAWLRSFSDTEARQILFELFECRGHLRDGSGLLQVLRDLENSAGWLLSRKGLFESAAKRKESLVELEYRYQAVIAEVRKVRSGLG
jgi:hypothetical protein